MTTLEYRQRLARKIFVILALFGLISFLMLCVTSCTLHPVIYKGRDGAHVVSLGGSVMTKSKTETASLSLPDGTTMSYSTTGKNETSVPNALIAGSVATSLADTQAVTDQAASAAAVKTTKIKSAEAIKINASNNALEAAKIHVP